jgi:hypothetical protein
VPSLRDSCLPAVYPALPCRAFACRRCAAEATYDPAAPMRYLGQYGCAGAGNPCRYDEATLGRCLWVPSQRFWLVSRMLPWRKVLCAFLIAETSNGRKKFSAVNFSNSGATSTNCY